ncbi:MAG: hypothetical protein ACI976_002285 [Aureispira sp.]|jgi:hypothetical protein
MKKIKKNRFGEPIFINSPYFIIIKKWNGLLCVN